MKDGAIKDGAGETARMRRRDSDGAPSFMRRCICAVLFAPLLILASACKDSPDGIQEVYAAADSADQLMIGLKMYVTNEGVRQALLESDTAFVYENTGLTELRGVKLTFYTATGTQSSVLTSKMGTYRGRQGMMEAREDVLVVREDGARLTTSVLRYDQTKNEVSTDQPYVYVEGDRRAEGVGFVTDPNFRDLRTGSVTGRGGRSGFRLPQ